MIVTVNTSPQPKPRRSLGVVASIQDTGASPFGSTYWKSLLACPREFGLRYVVGLKPEITNDALSTGWLFHHCLEAHYKTILQHQASCREPATSSEFCFGGSKAGMKAAYAALAPFEGEQGYAEVTDDVRRMLGGYFDMYVDRDQWRILAVEETLIYQGEFDYSTRLDLVIEDLDRGGMFIVETKTARFITTELIDNYQLDLQILGQVWLLKKCVDLKRYPNFVGVKINISTKHKTPQHVRVDVAPSNAHLQAFYEAQRQWVALKKVMGDMGYPRSLGHCAGYARGYSRCQFFPLCHGQPGRGVAQWMKESPPFGFVREEIAP